MKKILSLVLAMVLVLALAVPAAASSQTTAENITYRGISIVIDGKTVNPQDANGNSVEPFILDGTTYLPVRAVAGAMGLNVDWDAATSTVTLTDGGSVNYGSGTPASSSVTKSVSITYRDIKLVINGKTVTPKDANGNTVEPFILDGTTYLPVRAVATALGADVAWDAATSTVTLTSNGSAAQSKGWLVSSVTYTYGDYYDEWTKYTYDSRNRVVTEINGSHYNDGVYTYNYTYDNHDNVTVCTWKDSYGNSGGYTWQYAYDAAGNIVTKIYSDDDGYTYRTDLTYDSHGYTTSYHYTDDYDDDYGTYVNLYSGNNLVKRTACDANGKEWYSNSYTYDSHGNILTQLYTESESDWWEKYEYTYDANGNELSSRYEDKDGWITLETYTYDSHNEVIQHTITYPSENYTFYYTNTYDANGNLVKYSYVADGTTYTTVYEYVPKN